MEDGMEWWKYLILIIGSSGFVALVNFLSERLKRKDSVKDKRSDAAEQLEELRTETTEQFTQVDNRFKAVETKLDTVAANTAAVMSSSKAQAYDRIRHLGMSYIKAGVISEEELHNLIDMHDAYRELGGDSFLDRVMDEVIKLGIKPN